MALPITVAAWAVVPRAIPPAAPTEAGGSGGPPFPWAILVLTGGLMFLVMAFIFLAATRLPFLLEGIGVTSPGLIGLTLALMTVASFPTGLFYGRVRARLEPRVIAAFALALMGAGFAIISQFHALPPVMLGIVTTGLGLGLIIPNQNVWLMAHVPEAARGRASGLMTMLLFGGQFASPILSGALLTVMDLHAVFATFAAAILAVAAVLWLGAGTSLTRLAGEDR
jgi:MFS family permease